MCDTLKLLWQKIEKEIIKKKQFLRPTIFHPKAKLIFNVLDLPPHYIDGSKYDISRYPYINNPNRDFNPEKLIIWLQKADIITCICEEVKWQIKNWCGFDSVVIFNPIKDVSFLNLPLNR